MTSLVKTLVLTREASVARKFLAVTCFSALLVVASLVKVPLFFTPVPVTLQTFVVLLAGACLGPVYGAMSVGLYLTYGALGAPFFAGTTAGTAYLAGPTGGYLLGFLPAVGLVGFLRQRLSHPAIWAKTLVMLAGVAVIYTCGGLWLTLGFGWNVQQVLLLGVGPFIGVDLVKAFMAAVASR